MAVGVTTVYMVTMSGRFVPAIAMITGTAAPRQRGGFMSLNSCVQSVFSGVGTSLGGYLLIDHAGQPLGRYGLIGWIVAVMTILCVPLASRLRRPEGEIAPREAVAAEIL